MKITAISISDRKGIRKKNIEKVRLIKNHGLENDAHSGKWHRQVSFLAQESIDSMRDKGLDVVAGNFAENITTTGIDLTSLSVGDHLKIGETEIIISQLGKVCHHKCAIYYQAGDCVMPREGIFGVVKSGGTISVDDSIQLLPVHSPSVGIIGTKNTEDQFGGRLKTIIDSQWDPAFTRFDRLSKSEDNLGEILKDLLDFQKIDKIVLIDPEGRHGLSLISYTAIEPGKVYKTKGSYIYYCKNDKDLEVIAQDHI